jgi:hypothetical protein
MLRACSKEIAMRRGFALAVPMWLAIASFAGAEEAAPAARHRVLVELFTSQG